MSKFFRSSPDSDSDSSTSSDSEHLQDESERGTFEPGPNINQHAVTLAGSSEAPKAQGGAMTVVSASSDRRDILLHALLEDKCDNDVRKQYPDASEAFIERKAHDRYQALSAKLGQVGLAAHGLAGDDHQDTRLQYKRGLDRLAESIDASPASNDLRPSMQRLLTATDMPGIDSHRSMQQLQLNQREPVVPPALGHLVPQRLLLGPSRYREEFEEIGVLGRGGYGVVYQCKHKLDGIIYAVKKVPVSHTKNKQILTRGKTEVDALLAELRVLAQLDHPNIVRYFSGWIDWLHADAPERDSRSSEMSDAVLGATDGRSAMSFGRVITESDDHVLFENSTSQATSKSTASTASESAGERGLVRTASRGTHATVSDEDVESINRNDEPSESMVTGTDGIPHQHHAGPQLALHMQMALYPMTLTDFLAPEQPQSAVPALKHCFHLKPSVRILLAILDGVAYLHHQQIVHRDLKPGNIFLAPNPDPRHPDGSIDLWLCDACRAESRANPISLRVRIGDFGLVTALARDDADVPGSSPVGTELYRPHSVVGNASPALDIFAVGVIALELLWPFGTRMERHATLNALRQGRFPPGFDDKVGDERMRNCIKAMLEPDCESVEEIRRRLYELL